MKSLLLLAGIAWLLCSSCGREGQPAPVALHRGLYEVTLPSKVPVADPYLGLELKVTFTRPDSSSVTVDGFYDGALEGKSVFKARAYSDQVGKWTWTATSNLADLDGQRGAFSVSPSKLPGKLRKHPGDPHQFAYDNGQWFLHIGDTGYRYLTDTEPEWQAYIDQAVQLGATKLRVWFSKSRSGVEALLQSDRSALNLEYWQEMDRRLQYALNHYPQVMLKLIPYGEDLDELRRYGEGDRMAQFIAAYSQARFSAFPNVLWCVSNDRTLVADDVPDTGNRMRASLIDQIARDMAAREPWGALLTNHQARNTGYAFATAPWSDISTLEALDEVTGNLLLEYREKSDDPVINDEDRYELYRPPAHPRYFFRRLMWASLLSGGAATYGGAKTYEPYDGQTRGVRGYYDLKKEGLLSGGADDFVHIHTFFDKTGLTLVGMEPADALVGGDPLRAKAIASEAAIIVYLPNPSAPEPGLATAARTPATCSLQLPESDWALTWFNPRTGKGLEEAATPVSGGAASCPVQAPFTGDAVLLARRTDR
jgi:hypothetical protein